MSRSHVSILPVLIIASVLSTIVGCGGASPAGPKPARTNTPSASAPAAAQHRATRQPPPKLTRVTVAIPFASATFVDYYVARDFGLFAKYGLAPTFETMKTPTAMAAVLKGSVTFLAAASSTIRAAETGVPVKMVYVSLDDPPFVLVGSKNVTSIGQLKGATLALKSPTDAITAVGEALLKEHGLLPGSYKPLFLGTIPAEVAAISNGLASATVLSLSEGLPLTHKGFHLLASATTLGIPTGGLGVSDAELRAHPSVVRDGIRALMAAAAMIRTDRSRVVSLMEKDFHLHASTAQQVYRELVPTFTKDGRPTPQAMQRGFALDREALTVAHAKFAYPFKKSQIYDFSLLPKKG